MPPVLELNRDSIEILELTHTMSRAAICRFRLTVVANASGGGDTVGEPVNADDSKARFSFGDTERLANRREVRYTADDGTVLFVGKVLPAQRSIGADDEAVEYWAADLLEYLGNNPCDEVNRFYNRNKNQSIASDYPSDVTIEGIVAAEFARLIGSPTNAEHLIESVDWSAAQDLRDLVVYDFTTEGKTWLQLLDDLRGEIPMLGYWIDPREADRTNDTRGVTLRFYNLSPKPDGDDEINDNERVKIVLPMREGLASVSRINALECQLDEDISQSFDRLTIKGWGSFSERSDKLDRAWDAAQAGSFSMPDDYPLATTTKRVHPTRWNATLLRWERYSDAGGNGQWLIANTVWNPGRTNIDAQRAFKRYKTPDKPDGSPRRVIDFKVVQRADGSLEQVGPAVTLSALEHVWYAGPLSFTINGSTYIGSLTNGIKYTVFTGGEVNDWGDVRPNVTYYPDYPNGPGGLGSALTPLFDIGSPAVIDGNMLLLGTALIRETKYLFSSNIDGAGWNNIPNNVVSLFWPQGYDVWATYTQWDDFTVTRYNSLFGYEKHLVLYEPRFFKYVNIEGDTLRDDTAIMTEFADLLFDLITRPRYYGNAVIDVTEFDHDAEVFNRRANRRDIFMGAPVQIENWKPGNVYTLYSPRVLIQTLDLTKYDSERTVGIGFDNPQTFVPLENTKQFRSFFAQSFSAGVGGTNSIGGCGCGPTVDPYTTTRVPPTTTPPPVSTGTSQPPTTTPPTSSSGTTNTNSTSDTTPSTSTNTTNSDSTAPPGSTTTDTTTPGSSTTTDSTTPSSPPSTSGTQSTQTAGPGEFMIGTTSTSSTTPAPAEQYTGAPIE